ncbi:MAG: signal peptidase I [Bacteroidales bacterium]|nr:signal peptidase I [Clostridium sp.]MCM1203053.1 signal peptidase I [Bacteroidales bacterium]
MAGKSQNTKQKEEISIIKELIGMIIYMAFVVFAVWLIITFVGERTEVSGDSMYATLEEGDNLWIDKLSYRFKEPERFDIIVFPYQDPYLEKSVFYIKRIIGLPGERLRIEEDGTIYINNEPLEENYGLETISPNMIGRAKSNIILGEDEYFVMGDNRNNSKDSRYKEVGNISRKELKGKAVLRIWPFSKIGKIE